LNIYRQVLAKFQTEAVLKHKSTFARKTS